MSEKEYLERNELIGNLKRFAPEYYSDLIDDLITKQPAADVKPVRHGRWEHIGEFIKGGVDWWACSECKTLEGGGYASYPYCPNCGAKMDAYGGEQNEK